MKSISRHTLNRSFLGQLTRLVQQKLLTGQLLLVGALLLAACQPIADTRTGQTVALPAVAVQADSPLEAASDAGMETSDATAADSAETVVTGTSETGTSETGTGATAAVAPALDVEILLEPAAATITARSLRVRAEPDPAAEVVAGAREGEVYPVIAISGDGAWVQIEIFRSATGEGWVSSNFISLEGDITETATAPVAQPSAAPADTVVPFGQVAPPTATVDTRSLIVRAEADEESEVIAGLSLGDSFNVLGMSPDGVWLQLELPEIEEGAGWIQANFVRLAGDLTAIPTIGEEEVDVEELPVVEADDAGTDDADTDETDMAEASEDMADEATAVEVLPTTLSTATVNTRSLFVRETPDTAADPVAGARQGESYPVIGESADGLWVLIQTPRSESGEGWVFAEFVDLE